MRTGTLQSIVVPAGRSAVFYATGDADWEHAALVYVDEYPLMYQLGNYERLVVLHIYARDYPQNILLSGWHKEGRPDGGLPWLPSYGTVHPGYAAWKDSASFEAPYNDLRVDPVFGPPIGSQGQPLVVSPSAYQVSTAERASQMAHLLTYFSTLAEAGAMVTTAGGTGSPSLDPADLSRRSVDQYLAESDPREPISYCAADLLVSALMSRAHEFEAGPLRDRLIDLTRQVTHQKTGRGGPGAAISP